MSSEFPRDVENEAAQGATFEEIYLKYEFAELVRLTVAAAAWLAGMRRRVARRRPDVSGRPSPGEINPAECIYLRHSPRRPDPASLRSLP